MINKNLCDCSLAVTSSRRRVYACIYYFWSTRRVKPSNRQWFCFKTGYKVSDLSTTPRWLECMISLKLHMFHAEFTIQYYFMFIFTHFNHKIDIAHYYANICWYEINCPFFLKATPLECA